MTRPHQRGGRVELAVVDQVRTAETSIRVREVAGPR
jgi:hypothetical protein